MAKQNTITSEIATRDHVLYYQAIGYLPDPDPVLRKSGKDITVYKDIMSDAHLSSVIEQRKSEVLCMEWEIDRGKSKSRHAKFILSIFDKLDLTRVISEILDCTLWGFQPLEILWETDGNSYFPSDIVGKPQEWFVFDINNNLKFRTKDNWLEGIDLPERKFLLARNKPTYLNPYGDKLLSKVFWPVTFKRGGFRFWLTMTEKYGMPHLLATIDNGYFDRDKEKVLGMLANMVQDAVAVVPETTKIDPIEVNKTASAGVYHELVNFCNNEISKAILTQTLTTEVQDGKGSYGAGKVHADRLKAVKEMDKRIVEKTLNQLIKWICELNFGDSLEAPKFVMYEEEDVDKIQAERDDILSRTGVKFTKKYYQKIYGFEEEDFEISEDKPAPPVQDPKNPPAQFSEGEGGISQDVLDKLLQDIPNQMLQLQIEQALKPVIDLVNSSSDYSEVMANLAGLYPKMRTSQLEQLLEKAIFVSSLWGRISANAE